MTPPGVWVFGGQMYCGHCHTRGIALMVQLALEYLWGGLCLVLRAYLFSTIELDCLSKSVGVVRVGWLDPASRRHTSLPPKFLSKY